MFRNATESDETRNCVVEDNNCALLTKPEKNIQLM